MEEKGEPNAPSSQSVGEAADGRQREEGKGEKEVIDCQIKWRERQQRQHNDMDDIHEERDGHINREGEEEEKRCPVLLQVAAAAASSQNQ